MEIKKLLKRIYQLDFSKCMLHHNDEFIIDKGISDFVTTFKKYDTENGIAVMPQGYEYGLFYSAHNGGEIYSSPKLSPDIVKFGFNIFGLKKGSFYRITIPARTTGNNIVITSDRSLSVSTDGHELLINEDLKDASSNKECYGIFRATSNEINLFFTVGKIYIHDIIIDEVEMFKDETPEEESVEKLEEGKIQLEAYGVFDYRTNPELSTEGKYIENLRITGKGILLFYDKYEDNFIIERDNANDILGESFINANYVVDININKLSNNGYEILEIENDLSPNTLKQGYIKFKINRAKNTSGRIAILINKIY